VLVEPDSPESLARGIRLLLEMPDLGQRLTAQAYRDVTALTWKKRVANILAFVNAS
jgi:glycosyltransferase involved in cell wall biosynthesis